MSVKRKYYRFIFFLAVIAAVFLVFAADSNAQQRQEEQVTDIVIRGNNTVNIDTILLKIKTAVGRISAVASLESAT